MARQDVPGAQSLLHTLVVMTWQEYCSIMQCFSDLIAWQVHDVIMHIISSR